MNITKTFFILVALFCCIVNANFAVAVIKAKGFDDNDDKDQITTSSTQTGSLVDAEVANKGKHGDRILVFSAKEKGTRNYIQHFEIHRDNVIVHEFGMDVSGNKVEASTYLLRGRRGKPLLYNIESKNNVAVVGPEIGLASQSTQVERHQWHKHNGNGGHGKRRGHHMGRHKWRHGRDGLH